MNFCMKLNIIFLTWLFLKVNLLWCDPRKKESYEPAIVFSHTVLL